MEEHQAREALKEEDPKKQQRKNEETDNLNARRIVEKDTRKKAYESAAQLEENLAYEEAKKAQAREHKIDRARPSNRERRQIMEKRDCSPGPMQQKSKLQTSRGGSPLVTAGCRARRTSHERRRSPSVDLVRIDLGQSATGPTASISRLIKELENLGYSAKLEERLKQRNTSPMSFEVDDPKDGQARGLDMANDGREHSESTSEPLQGRHQQFNKGSFQFQDKGRGQRKTAAFGATKYEDSLARSAPFASHEFQAVYNSHHSSNMTFRLEFDLTEDLDDELDEFNRITRVGNFREAKSFFDEHLRTYIDVPCVFVQYGDMLLKQGDYRSIELLDDSCAFPSTGHDGNFDTENEQVRDLQHSWHLIKAVALSHTQTKLSPVLKNIRIMRRSLPFKISGITSTKIKIILLELMLSNRCKISHADLPVTTKIDWPALYDELTRNGRIWDLREIIVERCSRVGSLEACRQIFGSQVQEPLLFRNILDDWTLTGTDESTLLALLDIFNYMVLCSMRVRRNCFRLRKQVLPFIKHGLSYADGVGCALIGNFPATLQTRPVLLWTFTKAAISLRLQNETRMEHEWSNLAYLGEHVPGLWVGEQPWGIALSTYVPIYQENPGWNAPKLPQKCSTLLKTTLETARELEDYKTEGLCLKELSMRSQHPSSMLNELANLQKITQLDIEGYESTTLSKYLICKDEDSASRLRVALSEDIWAVDDPSDLMFSHAAARDTIYQALLLNTAEQPRKLSIRAALRFYHILDDLWREIFDDYIPRSKDGSDPRDIRKLETQAHAHTGLDTSTQQRQMHGIERSTGSHPLSNYSSDSQSRVTFESSRPRVIDDSKRPRKIRPNLSPPRGDDDPGVDGSTRNRVDSVPTRQRRITREPKVSVRAESTIGAVPERPNLAATVEDVADDDQRQSPAQEEYQIGPILRSTLGRLKTKGFEPEPDAGGMDVQPLPFVRTGVSLQPYTSDAASLEVKKDRSGFEGGRRRYSPDLSPEGGDTPRWIIRYAMGDDGERVADRPLRARSI